MNQLTSWLLGFVVIGVVSFAPIGSLQLYVKARYSTQIGQCGNPSLFFEVEGGRNPGSLQSPSFVKDSAGKLYAFWPVTDSLDQPGVLYSSQFNGEDWTEPVDVLLSPEPTSINAWVMIDENDQIHAFWSAGSGDIWHSEAFAGDVSDANQWSLPEKIILQDPLSTEGDFAIGPQNDGWQPFVYGTEFSEIRYGESDSEFINWRNSTTIYAENDPETWVGRPSIAIGRDGTVFVGWAQLDQTLRYKSALYAISRDGGLTWSAPIVLGDGYYSGYVVPVDEDIFRIRIGGVGIGGRYISISGDAGNSWSPEVNISAADNIGDGMQGISMAKDSNGTWYILEQTGGSFAIVNWNGEELTAPYFLLTNEEITQINGPVQNGTMAISNGNVMHIFWQAGGPEWNQQLWYMHCNLPSPYEEPRILPTPSSLIGSIPELTATQTVLAIPTPLDTQIALFTDPKQDQLIGYQMLSIFFSTGIVVVFTVIVVLVRKMRRNQGRGS